METNTVVKSDADTVTLPVSVSGKKIRIASGEFTVLGNKYALSETFTYAIRANEENQWVVFYLMRAKAGGKIVIVVDELIGEEAPLDMSKDPDYDFLWYLACLFVPAKAENLDSAKLDIFHSKLPEEVPSERVQVS